MKLLGNVFIPAERTFQNRIAKSVNEKAVSGGEGRNRTVDTTIFSRMLYQLSYLATRTAKHETTNTRS